MYTALIALAVVFTVVGVAVVIVFLADYRERAKLDALRAEAAFYKETARLKSEAMHREAEEITKANLARGGSDYSRGL
jgi:hypothetical protein